MPELITNALALVHGGQRRALAVAARTAWNLARPYVRDVVETVGTVAGSVALERAVDHLRTRER